MTPLRSLPTSRYIYLTTRNMIAGHQRNGWKWDKRMEFGNLSRAKHCYQHGTMSIIVSNYCVCIKIQQIIHSLIWDTNFYMLVQTCNTLFYEMKKKLVHVCIHRYCFCFFWNLYFFICDSDFFQWTQRIHLLSTSGSA